MVDSFMGVLTLENDRIGLEVEKDQAVSKRDVNRSGLDDRLGNEHHDRTSDDLSKRKS
jgi:hypothetical protein